jgi:hypothetical protein
LAPTFGTTGSSATPQGRSRSIRPLPPFRPDSVRYRPSVCTPRGRPRVGHSGLPVLQHLPFVHMSSSLPRWNQLKLNIDHSNKVTPALGNRPPCRGIRRISLTADGGLPHSLGGSASTLLFDEACLTFAHATTCALAAPPEQGLSTPCAYASFVTSTAPRLLPAGVDQLPGGYLNPLGKCTFPRRTREREREREREMQESCQLCSSRTAHRSLSQRQAREREQHVPGCQPPTSLIQASERARASVRRTGRVPRKKETVPGSERCNREEAGRRARSVGLPGGIRAQR